MSETRIVRGLAENKIWKVKISGSGLVIGRSETTHFTEGDPSERSWEEPFKREPHADMVDLFKALSKYAIEIYRLDPKTVKDVEVTGFSVKKWDDDNDATVYLHGKYRAMDDQMIPMSSIGINIAATAYKNKVSLNNFINQLIEEANQYIYSGKSSAPWTLWDNIGTPTMRVLGADKEGEGEGNGEGGGDQPYTPREENQQPEAAAV